MDMVGWRQNGNTENVFGLSDERICCIQWAKLECVEVFKWIWSRINNRNNVSISIEITFCWYIARTVYTLKLNAFHWLMWIFFWGLGQPQCQLVQVKLDHTIFKRFRIIKILQTLRFYRQLIRDLKTECEWNCGKKT